MSGESAGATGWPRKHSGSFFKTPRTATKIAKHRQRQARTKKENDNKAEVRRRDKGCRFPLCGCKKLGLALKARPEVSHDRHKGAGGNPDGSRSAARHMIHLCLHRHQDGIFSRHKNTIRNRYLDQELANNGPIAWDIKAEDARDYFGEDAGHVNAFDLSMLPDGWLELARESKRGQLLELLPWQRRILERLAEMEL